MSLCLYLDFHIHDCTTVRYLMGGGQTLRITASTGMPSSFLPNNVGQVIVDASETV